MPYHYVSTSQRPTAVSHAIVCEFTSPGARDLIITKGNRVEVHTASADGITPVSEFGLNGQICSLNQYRPTGMATDVLYILTAKKYFCVLGFDAENSKIVSRAMGCVRDRIGRDHEQGPSAIIDPGNRMIAMSLYERHLKMIPIEANGMREAYNVRIEELRPIDIQFLYGCEKPTLCLLYEDNSRNRHLTTYIVDSRTKSLTRGPWKQENLNPETTHILPVMEPMKGVVLFAKSSISYVGGASSERYSQSIVVKPMFVSCYGRIDERGTRYAVGDDKGNLYVFVITSSGDKVTSLELEYLGNTAICTSLCYLGSGVVFVGSSLSDSQLIKLRSRQELAESNAEKGDEAVVEVLSTYSNVGPILDMTVVKSASNGQAQIVTCSGALGNGSLRVVRSGIGVQEHASVEMEGITRMWSLRGSDSSPFDSSLVQSFSRETRILSIEEEELSEGFIPGFRTADATLFAGNMSGNLVIQVTTSEVVAISMESNEVVFTYVSEKRITVAEGNMTQLAIATSGSEVIYFECAAGSVSLVSRCTLDHDVACMSMRALPVALCDSATTADLPPEPPKLVCEDNILNPYAKSYILAVGMWTDGTVRLLSLPSLREVIRTSLGTDVQVRDLLVLHSVEVPVASSGSIKSGMPKVKFSSFLVAGLGDGCIISYSMGVKFDDAIEESESMTGVNTITAEQFSAIGSATNYSLHTRRRVVLGARPISLSCFLNRYDMLQLI